MDITVSYFDEEKFLNEVDNYNSNYDTIHWVDKTFENFQKQEEIEIEETPIYSHPWGSIEKTQCIHYIEAREDSYFSYVVYDDGNLPTYYYSLRSFLKRDILFREHGKIEGSNPHHHDLLNLLVRNMNLDELLEHPL